MKFIKIDVKDSVARAILEDGRFSYMYEKNGKTLVLKDTPELREFMEQLNVNFSGETGNKSKFGLSNRLNF